MKTSDAWKLFITRSSVHHYLARRVLTGEACLAAGVQVRCKGRIPVCVGTLIVCGEHALSRLS